MVISMGWLRNIWRLIWQEVGVFPPFTVSVAAPTVCVLGDGSLFCLRGQPKRIFGTVALSDCCAERFRIGYYTRIPQIAVNV